MCYVRGHPYDRWENEGAEGWSYADCLPYVKRAQCHELGEDAYRGGDGPLHAEHGKIPNPLYDDFLNAAVEYGYPLSSDVNGYQQEWFSKMDLILHKGVRWHTYNAYLRAGDIQKRENLTIHSMSFAERVLFEGTKAVGIEYIHNKNNKKIAKATCDIILS